LAVPERPVGLLAVGGANAVRLQITDRLFADQAADVFGGGADDRRVTFEVTVPTCSSRAKAASSPTAQRMPPRIAV